MIDFGKDVPLHHDLLLLVAFEDVLFFEDFDGIEAVVGEVAGQDDFSIGPPADN